MLRHIACVLFSCENPDWYEELFELPYPWHCDELMMSSEDMVKYGEFRETVSNFAFVFMHCVHSSRIMSVPG